MWRAIGQALRRELVADAEMAGYLIADALGLRCRRRGHDPVAADGRVFCRHCHRVARVVDSPLMWRRG